LKQSKSKHAILGLLAQGSGSGYDIKKIVEQKISHFWNESYGQIYPILKDLAATKLVSRKVERQTGKPDRQVYTITARGRASLDDWLSEPAQFQVLRNETLLKLFFGHESDTDANLRLIQRYRDYHLQLIDGCAELEKELKRDHPGDTDLPYWLMTIDHCRVEARAVLRWCDVTLKKLADLDEPTRGRKPRATPVRQRR